MSDPVEVARRLLTAERVDYSLAYRRGTKRPLTSSGLGVMEMDCSAEPGVLAPGGWGAAEPLGENPTPDDLLQFWLKAAICEGVHEVLEWFQVDGSPMLDPHGEHEDLIMAEAAALSERLANLTERASHAS